MEINFEHLNLIPQILEELKSLNAKLSSIGNATNQKRWLSTEELATYIGYSKDTIYKLKDDEFAEGVHWYKKGRIFFDRIAIDAWIVSGYNPDAKKNVSAMLDNIIAEFKRKHSDKIDTIECPNTKKK